MGKTGEALAADLYRLLVVARNDLPSVADAYHECAKHSGSAGTGAAAAMTRPVYFGGRLGPVHDAWVDLHEKVHRHLAVTGENLDDAAAALELAARQYHDTDATAGQKLDALLKQNGDPAGERGTV
ncbi:hypothetical protein [Rhizomonospora bruguierae]|uniref:hypothetical protein n=1 Tax=Rhizomonospora bruguierae TaxID=1581705 RepID=UPI001BCD63DD|nr:hypothetical protein [Micromonospora sp. NBRC 107566]